MLVAAAWTCAYFELTDRLRQWYAGSGGDLMLLEVCPDRLNLIEFRGVGRQWISLAWLHQGKY